MPLSGTGMLISFMDVDPDEEIDFNDWYDKEHLAERVAIDGFTEARRYVAVTAAPKYLGLYTTSTFDVLDSPAYRNALQSQTARSLHHIGKLRNGGRAIVHITISRGQGRGSALFFAGVRPKTQGKDELRAMLEKRLSAIVGRHGIISAHVAESDPELSKPLTEAAPPPNAGDWYIILDGTDPKVVEQVGNELIGDADLTLGCTVISHGVYRLLWDLSKAEL